MSIENNEVIIVGEISKGELASHTFELVTLARNIGKKLSVVLSVNTNGSFDQSASANELGSYGVEKVHFIDCGSGLSGAGLAKYIAEVAGNASNVIVLGPQTYLGRDVISQLSVLCDRSVLSNAINVAVDGDDIQSEHAVFGGTKIVKAKVSGGAPYLVLVRPKSVVPETGNTIACEIVSSTVACDETAQTQIVSSEKNQTDGPDLEDATIVVSGGRGLGTQENYETLIAECAKALGGAPAASRAIVDAGWVPYSYQVGQTGKTVKPDVYIACGISGATQHLVGMKGSKKIIAINTDDQAPIFSVADLGVVGDVNVIMPALIEKIKAKKS